MSITVRLWSKKELQAIKSGKDKFLATVFMNRSTFSQGELKHYPYHLRRTYIVFFNGQDEPVVVHAVNDQYLIKFLKAEYDAAVQVDKIEERITKYRDVKLV